MVATLQFGRGQESDVDGYWSHHADAPSFIPATEAHSIRFYFYTSDDFRTLATVNGAPTLKTRDTRFSFTAFALGCKQGNRADLLVIWWFISTTVKREANKLLILRPKRVWRVELFESGPISRHFSIGSAWRSHFGADKNRQLGTRSWVQAQ